LRNTAKRTAEKTNGEDEANSGESDGEDVDEERQPKKSARMGVDDFMKGGFVNGMEDGGSDDDGEDEELEEDDASLQDIEDLSDEEEDHAQDLAKLAKKDPEFFKYLQENDQELLDFGNDDDDDEDEDMEEEVSHVKKGKKKAVEKQAEVVTSAMLKGWQKSILQVSHLLIRGDRKILTSCFTRHTHLKLSDDSSLLSEQQHTWETKRMKNQ
jgi:nucleolar complex protein 2